MTWVLLKVALLLYDYVLTLRREIVTIWCRKFRAASYLFLANRYLALFYGLLLILTDQTHSPTNCIVTARMFQATSDLLTIIFGPLRVYAIWNRSRVLFTVIMCINLIPVATNIYMHTQDRFTERVLSFATVCVSTTVMPHLLRNNDGIVIFCTWWKTTGIRQDASSAHVKITLTRLLLRDGTVFFLALLGLNMFQVILVETAEVPGYMMAPMNVLTPVLISHFMLDLREIGHDVPEPMDDFSYFAGHVFHTTDDDDDDSAQKHDMESPRVHDGYNNFERLKMEGRGRATDDGASVEMKFVSSVPDIVELPRLELSDRTLELPTLCVL
ncbi:hypothetical protein BDW22DRAFT_1342693 [Trametopsis cervina]|nr:hypothetical protein BDW22DRAFT_1342693 [Trametopsis cervina]